MRTKIYFSFLLAFCLVFGVTDLQAQSFLNRYHDTTIHHYGVEANFNGNVQASAIGNDVINKLIFGGAISNESIQNSLDRHKSFNRLGLIVENNITFQNLKANLFGGRWGYQVSANLDLLSFGKYTKDLFGLGFQGNENYLGKEVSLDGTQFLMTNFYKVGFGLVEKKSKSFVQLNVLYVNNYNSAYIPKSNFSFSTTGDQIDLSGNASYEALGKKSIGIGLSVDFAYNFPVSWFQNTAVFQLSGHNLGFAYMDKVNHYQVDTSVTYSGFNLEQLLSIDRLTSDDFSLLDSLGVPHTKNAKTVFIPGYIEFAKVVSLNSMRKFQSILGIRLYPSIFYVPVVYMGADYKINDQFHLGLINSLGGFGGYRLGMYASYKQREKKALWCLGSENMLGFVSKTAQGLNFNAKLIWRL